MNKEHFKRTIKPLHQLLYLNIFFVGTTGILSTTLFYEPLFVLPMIVCVAGFIGSFKALNKRLVKIVHESN
jgi:cytochrome b561